MSRGESASAKHRATERASHLRGDRADQEISLTPESRLLAYRRFFGERDEVPWSFKTEVLRDSGTFTSNRRSNRSFRTCGTSNEMTGSGPCSSVGRARPW